jgi:hypothetical protein
MSSRSAFLSFLLIALAVLPACHDEDKDRAQVRFFVDVSSKAPEPGFTVRYTYVIWNEGAATARNVVMPIPLEMREPYDRLTWLAYVPGSLEINHDYHPDTSHESYAFVPRTPLTDAAGDDAADYDPETNTLHVTLAELLPDDYLVLTFEAAVDPGAPCGDRVLMQNWTTIAADNSAPYENDINGHIVCHAPRLTADATADPIAPAPGELVTITVAIALEETVVDGAAETRFDLARVRVEADYALAGLTLESIANEGEDRDGTVFWQVRELPNGGSGAVTFTARVPAGTPAGTVLSLPVHICSQNTVDAQNVGDTLDLVVSAP